mmetsp:Transcript_18030/g.44547  ORF Transcript_18030/g.44547 Transcript_18030/m.44547 type:complete len:476 (-) Transcript_18030:70-1497(-)
MYDSESENSSQRDELIVHFSDANDRHDISTLVWDFEDFNILSDLTYMDVYGGLDPNDGNYEKFLRLLRSDRRRWSEVNFGGLDDYGSPSQSSLEFLSLLAATVQNTDHYTLTANCYRGAPTFACLNTGMSNIKEITLECMDPMTAAEMEVFAQGLASSSCKLTTLTFSHFHFGPDIADFLNMGLERNRSLQCLRTENCGLEPEVLSALVSTLHHIPTMTSLTLSGAEMYSVPVQNSLRKWLERDDCKLEELDVSPFTYRPSSPSNFTLDIERPNLSIQSIKIEGIKVESSSMLMRGLPRFEKLVKLDLGRCNISDDLQLLDSLLLGETCRLESLILDRNPVSNEAGKIFAKKLPRMRKLKHLSLRDVKFLEDNTTAIYFRRCVTQNRSLEELYPFAIWKQLKYSLQLNRAWRRHLGHNPGSLPLNLLPLVIQRITTIGYHDLDYFEVGELSLQVDGFDATFELLRENNVLQASWN